MKKSLLLILQEYDAAQRKHPEFAENIQQGLNIITEEYLELVRAVNDNEGKERIVEEAAQMGATILRFLEMLNDE